MSVILDVRNAEKYYGNKSNLTAALNDLSFSVYEGEFVGIMGASGSGKTTLIKLINGLLTPNSGEILVDGGRIGAESKAVISYLPDKLYFSEWMTVNQLIEYYGDFYLDFDKDRAYQMLANLGINPASKLKVLSKGTKEKVQLILVMSRRARLYILDEPIGGVDPASRDYILDTIIRAHNPDSSVVISTHLITDIEPALNEVIMIKYGNLALQGDANQLRNTFGKSLNDIFKEVFAGC
jgi:ABC-2 type transport system ATP-binding protein